MKTLNYHKVMALKPTIYATFTNKLGQEIVLIEHPLKGEDSPVLIVYHAEKLCVVSEFYDTDDMLSGQDYEPVYMYGEMQCTFECMELKGNKWV